jgi:chloramphenicol 3-O-phosphotransferase
VSTTAFSLCHGRNPRTGRGLADVVHRFCDYEVVVDTGKNDPQTCAGQVLEALTSCSDPE